MSALITLTLRNGTLHLCDESCYDAQTDDCLCICGGLNHGAGLHLAERNTIVEATQLVDDIHHDYPDFQEVRFHFHNTADPENADSHKEQDALSAALPHPNDYQSLDAEQDLDPARRRRNLH